MLPSRQLCVDCGKLGADTDRQPCCAPMAHHGDPTDEDVRRICTQGAAHDVEGSGFAGAVGSSIAKMVSRETLKETLSTTRRPLYDLVTLRVRGTSCELVASLASAATFAWSFSKLINASLEAFLLNIRFHGSNVPEHVEQSDGLQNQIDDGAAVVRDGFKRWPTE